MGPGATSAGSGCSLARDQHATADDITLSRRAPSYQTALAELPKRGGNIAKRRPGSAVLPYFSPSPSQKRRAGGTSAKSTRCRHRSVDVRTLALAIKTAFIIDFLFYGGRLPLGSVEFCIADLDARGSAQNRGRLKFPQSLFTLY